MSFNPMGVYKFSVEIKGIIVGGFTEVSGLSMETEVETVQEGGLNEFEYKLPKRTKYSNLVLKRGMMDVDSFGEWFQNVNNNKGRFLRYNGTISLLDDSGNKVMWWDFFEAYPIKWEGPTLNAESSQVAFETLTLAIHRLEKPKSSISASKKFFK